MAEGLGWTPTCIWAGGTTTEPSHRAPTHHARSPAVAARRPHRTPTQANAAPAPAPPRWHQENQMKNLYFLVIIFQSEPEQVRVGVRRLPAACPHHPRRCQLIPAPGALVLSALGTPRQRHPTTSSPRMTAPGTAPSTGMCPGMGGARRVPGGSRGSSPPLCRAGSCSRLPGARLRQLHLPQAIPHQQELRTRVWIRPRCRFPLVLRQVGPGGVVWVPAWVPSAVPMTWPSPDLGVPSMPAPSAIPMPSGRLLTWVSHQPRIHRLSP